MKKRNLWAGLAILAAQTLFAGEVVSENLVDRYFPQAVVTSQSLNFEPPLEGFRWKTEQVKLAIFVDGDDKKEVLRSLSDLFAFDMVFVSDNSGKEIEPVVWSRENLDAQIFLLIGNEEELLTRASYLEEWFSFPFEKELRLRSQTGQSMCYQSTTVGRDGSIQRGVMVVDKSDDPTYCFRRSLIHSFGLFGDLPEEAHSILKSDASVVYYTELDGALLRRLYNVSK